MSCIIDAWLKRRKPCLRILDTSSGTIWLHWDYKKISAGITKGVNRTEDLTRLSPTSVQNLMRDLFLLSCAVEITGKERIDAVSLDVCLGCGGCEEQTDTDLAGHYSFEPIANLDKKDSPCRIGRSRWQRRAHHLDISQAATRVKIRQLVFYRELLTEVGLTHCCRDAPLSEDACLHAVITEKGLAKRTGDRGGILRNPLQPCPNSLAEPSLPEQGLYPAVLIVRFASMPAHS